MSTPKSPRSAGILLHPTSLPGPYGIGDLGPTAYEWVDLLARARQTWWQVLPLGPTAFGDSPYQCFSAFAGNPYLVSPELLGRDGLLKQHELNTPNFPADRVNYGNVIKYKLNLVARAWDNYRSGAAPGLKSAFEDFSARQAHWLDDYSLFMALKDSYQGAYWPQWSEDLVLRKPEALEQARKRLAGGIGLHKFGQFLFFRQWSALKEHAHNRGIKLMGDAPIFVSSDSADVWANPELFMLDARRRPTVVAGVPPDYFSPTGQLWGNPHYNWEALKKTGYAWWVARLRATIDLVDVVRLDHFRGFEASWEVPAGKPTAEVGRWVPGPGASLLSALRAALGGLPLVAEDLGIITPEVEALRVQFNLPGMRILQFAFSGPDNRFLPHHYDPHTVVYTGTHDNDTTVGWYRELPGHEKAFMHRYAPGVGHDIAWDLIRMAWSSVAHYALAPAQDLLSLPTQSRMNYPGRPADNWRWRLTTGQINQGVLDRLADLTVLFSRER